MNPSQKYLTYLIVGFAFFSLSSCDVNQKQAQNNPTSVPETSKPIEESTNNNKAEPSQLQATPEPTPADNQSIIDSEVNSSNKEPSVPATKNNTDKAVTTNNNNQNKTVNVTIYHVDNQCEKLVPEEVNVAANNSLEAAVGKVIAEQNNGDFQVAGYRVQIDSRTGLATVDLRLPPNASRQFTSLSSCEQFALFGSIQQTLTANQQWKIKDVRFTERGQEIFL